MVVLKVNNILFIYFFFAENLLELKNFDKNFNKNFNKNFDKVLRKILRKIITITI